METYKMKVVQLHELMSSTQNIFDAYPNPKTSPLGPQKVKIKCQNLRKYKNESCSTTRVDQKTVVEPHSEPQTSPLGPQKDKNETQIKSWSNVSIQVTIENESYSTGWVDTKTVFYSTWNH